MIKKLIDMNLTEYDLRQLHLMNSKLDLFISKQISINILINDLESLWYCLESVDIEWKNEFCSYWLELEISYAIALDNKESINNYNKDIFKAITQLKKLLLMN